MDARDTAILRDHLINIKARIEHWKADTQSNLLPTEGSLATAHYHAEAALKLLAKQRAAA